MFHLASAVLNLLINLDRPFQAEIMLTGLFAACGLKKQNKRGIDKKNLKRKPGLGLERLSCLGD